MPRLSLRHLVHGLLTGTAIAYPGAGVPQRAMSYYRADGVRITHDPYSPGMSEKYGAPGKTDSEGFDPYRDTVGPGIYGGRVQRDELGRVVVGRQYQNHNPRPGPVYAGGGYTPVVEALRGGGELAALLQKHPDLVNDVTTGGALPLHMCGMGRENQKAVRALVEGGADIEALDTYGMTPLHRMASNNLALGARLLLQAGADPNFGGKIGEPPASVARSGAARDVMKVLQDAASLRPARNNMAEVRVDGAEVVWAAQDGAQSGQKKLPAELAEVGAVNGVYTVRPASEIPSGFAKVCQQQGWGTEKMWAQLQGGPAKGNPWFKHQDNESYIYRNLGDGMWWIDGPSGNGVFIAEGPPNAVPAHGWKHLGRQGGAGSEVVLQPAVRTFRKVEAWADGEL